VRVLFGQGNPAPLRHLLLGHEVATAYELGWSTLLNGELLAAAEGQGFQVLVTTDTHLKYQQNLAARSIAIVILGTTRWPRIKVAAGVVLAAINSATVGSYAEVAIP
jgi:hypothetical protein